MRGVSKSLKVIKLFKSLENLFRKKIDYFDLFKECSFKAEDWIKTEIVKRWYQRFGHFFVGISQKIDDVDGRPDLSLGKKHRPLTIELKVLPTDRNYPTAASRFSANKNNKKDFERLTQRKRDFIIYVFWKESSEWEKQSKKLVDLYPKVALLSEFRLNSKHGVIVFSLWGHPRSHHRVVKY